MSWKLRNVSGCLRSMQSAGPKNDGADLASVFDGSEILENERLVELQFLSYYRVGYCDDQGRVALDTHGVAVLGVGRPHDLDPLFSNSVFERLDPDFVAVEDLVEDGAHVDGFADDRGVVLRDSPEIGDQILRASTELVFGFRHG